MSTLNYADLKTAFASVPNLTWPTPTKAQCLTIYPPTQISGTAPTLSLSSIEAALSNLSGVQMNSFDFTSGLPDCFQSIETTLKNDLSIKQILVGVGNPISGANGTIEYPVNGFSFELQLTITPNPTVGDLTLDNLVLELNCQALNLPLSG